MVILALCRFTVKDDVPLLPECALSPPYVAVTVMELGEFAAGVNTVVQSPDDSVHEEGLNVPPAVPSLHDTVPVGAVGEVEVSAIVAVSEIDPAEETVPGLGATVTVVE